jgi:hypothetical protein
MRRDEMRYAVAAREDGLRRVRSLTVRVGAVGVVSSAAIAVALGHPAGAASRSTTGNGAASQNQTGTSSGAGTSPGTSSQGNSSAGSSQAGNSQSSGSQANGSQAGNSPQAPVQNLAPATGSGQAVSGGS